jgi:CRISPR-associated protein Cas2
MLILVCYDISNDKRRNKIYNLLSSYGIPVQFSIFECELNDKTLISLKKSLFKLIDNNQDKIRIYNICNSCSNKIDSINSNGIHNKLDTLII